MTDTATHTSERRCIHTRQTAPRDGLIRFAVSPDGEVVPDLEEKPVSYTHLTLPTKA